MFPLTLETKVTQIYTLHLEWPFEHCVGVHQVHKRTCKVGDFKLEKSTEEQRLDWLDNSVWC